MRKWTLLLLLLGIFCLYGKEVKAEDTTWQEDYTYELDEENHYINLIKYKKSSADITVPAKATLNGIEYATCLKGDGKFSIWSTSDLELKSLVFENGIILSPNQKRLFYELENLVSLDLSSFNTENVTDMADMFCKCNKLEVIDISGWDVSNVTNMSSMFYSCSNLKELNISDWNVEKVVDMSYMFSECSNLIELDLSSFHTSSLLKMNRMFSRCTNLSKLTFSNFDTHNITDMGFLFYECSNLTELNLSSFDTSSVTNMAYMFSDCKNLAKLDLSNFNTANVTDMSWMFHRCFKLTNLNISNFDTANVTSMYNMFDCCYVLESLDVSSFNTSNVTNMFGMFSDCKVLQELNVSNFDTSNVTDMSYMFDFCNNISEIDVSGFNTSKVTNMNDMFSGCNSISHLDLSEFDTSNVLSMRGMFLRCDKLSELDLTSFNTSNVTDIGYMFSSCSSLVNLNLSSFNTEKVTKMDGLFSNCSALESINLTSFKTNNVTTMYEMFSGCSKLNNINLQNFNTEKVTDMYRMFYDCRGLKNIDLSNFDTSNLKDAREMFLACYNCESINLSNWDLSNCTKTKNMVKGSSSYIKTFVTPKKAAPDTIVLPGAFSTPSGVFCSVITADTPTNTLLKKREVDIDVNIEYHQFLKDIDGIKVPVSVTLDSKPLSNNYYTTEYKYPQYGNKDLEAHIKFIKEYEGLGGIIQCYNIHPLKRLPAVAPTYDSGGLTEGIICTECFKTIKAQKYIPPLTRPAADARITRVGDVGDESYSYVFPKQKVKLKAKIKNVKDFTVSWSLKNKKDKKYISLKKSSGKTFIVKFKPNAIGKRIKIKAKFTFNDKANAKVQALAFRGKSKTKPIVKVFVLNVVKKSKIKSLSITGPSSVRCGKSIYLKKHVDPKNAKTGWKIKSGSRYATISYSGKLKAKNSPGKKVKVCLYEIGYQQKKKFKYVSIKK